MEQSSQLSKDLTLSWRDDLEVSSNIGVECYLACRLTSSSSQGVPEAGTQSWRILKQNLLQYLSVIRTRHTWSCLRVTRCSSRKVHLQGRMLQNSRTVLKTAHSGAILPATTGPVQTPAIPRVTYQFLVLSIMTKATTLRARIIRRQNQCIGYSKWISTRHRKTPYPGERLVYGPF